MKLAKSKATGLVWLLVVVGILLPSLLWNTSPLFQERLYSFALHSGIESLEDIAAEAMRDYPGEEAAINLVLFINEKAPRIRTNLELQQIEKRLIEIADKFHQTDITKLADLQLELTTLTRREREIQVLLMKGQEEVNRISNTALWSLALISGQGFGTGYNYEGASTLWPSVQVNEWGTTLEIVNNWAVATFYDARLDSLPVSSREVRRG